MNNIKYLTSFAWLFLCSTASYAGELTIYGKASLAIAYQDTDGAAEDQLDIESRASRIGVKGEHELTNTLTAIYQVELGVDLDGSSGTNSGDFLSERNTYIGIRGAFGTLLAGTYDTPLKKTEGKIDLFSDREDINKVLDYYVDVQERETEFLGWYSPTYNGMKFAVSTMNGKTGTNLGDAWSVSATMGDSVLKKSDYYLAVAYDDAVDGNDTSVARVAGSTGFGSAVIGAILEQAEDSAGNDQFRYVFSGSYQMGKNKLLLQYVDAEAVGIKGSSYSFTGGVDHKLSSDAKAYVMAGERGIEGTESTYLSVGLEYNF